MAPSAFRRPGLAAAVVVAVVAAACSARQPLPTYTVAPGASPAGQLLTGTMTTVEGSPCIHVKQLGRRAVSLLWPPAFTTSGNPPRVFDPHGSEVATEGDTVTVGGGWVDKWSVDCRTQGYFEVSDFARGEPTFAD